MSLSGQQSGPSELCSRSRHYSAQSPQHSLPHFTDKQKLALCPSLPPHHQPGRRLRHIRCSLLCQSCCRSSTWSQCPSEPAPTTVFKMTLLFFFQQHSPPSVVKIWAPDQQYLEILILGPHPSELETVGGVSSLFVPLSSGLGLRTTALCHDVRGAGWKRVSDLFPLPRPLPTGGRCSVVIE